MIEGNSMKYIERNYNESAVHDFIVNVQNEIGENEIVEEVYEKGELVGWEIKPLINSKVNAF